MAYPRHERHRLKPAARPAERRGFIIEALAVASAVSSIWGSITGANAARRAANGSIAEGDRLAEDALMRGRETARRYGIDLAQLMGRQRTAMAGAQGLDLSQGTAAAIGAETASIGKQELALIRENARREAFGLRQAGRNQALGLRSQAAGLYGQAFASVLDFGANAWSYRTRRLSSRSSAPVSYDSGYGPPGP